MAVTQGPGLIGALLVGLSTAKAIAAARGLPLAPVDHLQGHVAANFLRAAAPPFEPPFLCLLASGGHTLLARGRDHDGFEVLGSTLDDAAGEAFDKGARMLGLGYPGGAGAGAARGRGRPRGVLVPGSPSERAGGCLAGAFAEASTSPSRAQDGAAVPAARAARAASARARADLAASYQAAIVERLWSRTERALSRPARHAGGRRRGGRQRRAARGACAELRRRVPGPLAPLCSDNAAMIACAARFAERSRTPGT